MPWHEWRKQSIVMVAVAWRSLWCGWRWWGGDSRSGCDSSCGKGFLVVELRWCLRDSGGVMVALMILGDTCQEHVPVSAAGSADGGMVLGIDWWNIDRSCRIWWIKELVAVHRNTLLRLATFFLRSMAELSPMTDTSTDGETDDKALGFRNGSLGLVVSDASDKSRDQKTLRRLAQNREAARKSRLRKKAYVQQLESSRMKLSQLEQELQRARQQFRRAISINEWTYQKQESVIRKRVWTLFVSPGMDRTKIFMFLGASSFHVEYSRWLDEQNRRISELREAVSSHAGDGELKLIVDRVIVHFDDIFRIKGDAAKADVFHILSGMWKTPAERCFLWLGGFRSSELLKLLITQLEPLTEQQLLAINNLQQTSQQAEDALSQGMDALQQSLSETLAGSLGPPGSSGNVANYMGQMAMAMGKLGTLEGFIRQADNLRQQTLQQMHRILTTRQSARALIAISDYFSRLRALSSLWLARPRE
ncbi:transcription factor TGA2.2-like protein [Tanacetum coccineum]